MPICWPFGVPSAPSTWYTWVQTCTREGPYDND